MLYLNINHNLSIDGIKEYLLLTYVTIFLSYVNLKIISVLSRMLGCVKLVISTKTLRK